MTTTELLIAANHALRSYQYGNASPDLAEEVADKIDEYLNATNGRAVLSESLEP